jgi:bifunctional non-homologous end joining protein LigD
MAVIPAPMLASPGGKPFTSPEWLYEIKFDGYRCLARVQDGAVELRTKAGTDCTAWYPELGEALSQVPGGPHVIDAEACVLDHIGRSDFNRLHERAMRRRWYAGSDAVTLCAFDLLFENGRNLMGLPLAQRKARLQRLVQGLPGVLFVSDLPAQAELFAQAVEPLSLEGIVAKRRASAYSPGLRSSDWIKIKRKGWQDGRVWRR